MKLESLRSIEQGSTFYYYTCLGVDRDVMGRRDGRWLQPRRRWAGTTGTPHLVAWEGATGARPHFYAPTFPSPFRSGHGYSTYDKPYRIIELPTGTSMSCSVSIAACGPFLGIPRPSPWRGDVKFRRLNLSLGESDGPLRGHELNATVIRRWNV